MSPLTAFTNGIYKENPIFRLVLGLCPTIAVSLAVSNGIGMGLAATFVLVGSNLIISLLRKLIPSEIRIPCFIVVIATFVTIVDLTMEAYLPQLHQVLGVFVPLIVVNCIILARAEAFAS
ncbi:MAG: electron transport complex subunit RsxE, partial [Bacillota bacterium]